MGTCEDSCPSVTDVNEMKPEIDCNGVVGGVDGDRESSQVEVPVEKIGGDDDDREGFPEEAPVEKIGGGGGDREGFSEEAPVEKIGVVDGDREGFSEEASVQKLGGDDGDRDGSSEQALVQELGSVRMEEEVAEPEGKGEDGWGEEENDGAVEAREEEEVEEEDWRKDKEGEDENENEGEEDWKEERKQNEYGLHHYPLRPDTENCSFYMKTGSCKFGSNCRFNHPTKRATQLVDADSKDYDFQRTGHHTNKIECKYYLSPEGCKYGDACRFGHSKERSDAGPAELNFLGLPIRLGEKECPFYMRNGSCGYGATCRFHHPDPTASVEEPKNPVANGGSLQAGRNFAASNNADFAPPMSSMAQLASTSSSDNLPSYMPWMNSLPQRMPQVPVYNHYQVPGSLPDNTLNSRPNHYTNSPLKKADSYGYHQQLAQNEQHPERPGQPECEYFIKTGTCKFGSACKYHHPKGRLHSMPNGLSHNLAKEATHLTNYPNMVQTEEYPERPGQLECTYFLKTGQCKYKSTCKYHHPKNQIVKPAATMYSMNGPPSGSAPYLPHEFKMLPDSYPSHLKPAVQPFRQHLQQTRRAEEFPERPGQAECEYFMKTGDCKYKSLCRFHHPKGSRNRVDASSACSLNEMGLPLRPGASTCRNYAQLGICKYGPRCLFDHPSNYDSSAIPQPLSPPSPPSNDAQSRGWEEDDWVM